MSAPWTDGEIATLKRLWPTHSARLIVAHLRGRSRSAVIGMAHRLGLDKTGARDRTHESHRRPVQRLKRPRAPSPARNPVFAAPEPPVRAIGSIAAVPSDPITIDELRWPIISQCRFILGDVTGRGPTLYCGAEVQYGSSYCRGHFTRTRARPARFAEAAE